MKRGTIYQQPGCTTWTIQYYRNGKRVRESVNSDDYRALSSDLLSDSRSATAERQSTLPASRQQLRNCGKDSSGITGLTRARVQSLWGAVGSISDHFSALVRPST